MAHASTHGARMAHAWRTHGARKPPGSIFVNLNILFIIYVIYINTPGTAGGPGGRDLTLAVKSRKTSEKDSP